MMKKTFGLSAAALAIAALTAVVTPAHANLVDNGGFETGDFTGWLETGIPDFNGAGVNCGNPATVHAGNCSAFIGPFITPGGLEQAIDVGGADLHWSLSFALQNEAAGLNSFAVRFGGETLLSLTDVAAGDYTLYQFSGVTTADTMTLAFEFFNGDSFFYLDSVALSVSASAVPEPASSALLGAGLAGLLALRRRKPA